MGKNWIKPPVITAVASDGEQTIGYIDNTAAVWFGDMTENITRNDITDFAVLPGDTFAARDGEYQAFENPYRAAEWLKKIVD